MTSNVSRRSLLALGAGLGTSALMGDVAQAGPQLAGGVAKVHFRHCGDCCHSCHLSIIIAGEAVRQGPDQRESNWLVD